MLEPTEIIRALPILRAISAEELAALPAERVERGAGGLFLEQGTPPDAAYGIITGRVQVMKKGPGGRELCLEVLGPGEVFGAVAVLRRILMPASAVAVEDTACVRIPSDHFRALMERHPSVPVRMLDVVARRLVDAADNRLNLATEDVETRVARALLRLGEKFGAEWQGEIVFSQKLTRHTLADLAGTTVESTIRVMSRWTREGIVRSGCGRLTIVRPQVLRQRVEGGTPASPVARCIAH